MGRAELMTEVPPWIGSVVTETVLRFADDQGLDAETRMHDLPLWSVSKRDRETGVIRRLQIGAYALDEAYEFRILPQVFRLYREMHVLVAAEEIDPRLIKGLDVSRVAKGDDLRALLKEAWSDVESMPAPGSPVVRVPVSPHYHW